MLLLDTLVAWLLFNFSLCMLVLATLFIVIDHRLHEKTAVAVIVYRWIALFCLGVTSLYAYIIHVWFPMYGVMVLGYTPSPYQVEVGYLDLIFALFVFATFNARYGYRMAIAVISACLLWTDVAAHLYEIYDLHLFSMANPISGLFVDLVVPLLLLVCARKMKLK